MAFESKGREADKLNFKKTIFFCYMANWGPALDTLETVPPQIIYTCVFIP